MKRWPIALALGSLLLLLAAVYVIGRSESGATRGPETAADPLAPPPEPAATATPAPPPPSAAQTLSEPPPLAASPEPVPLEKLLRLPEPDPRKSNALDADHNPHLRKAPPEESARGPRLRDRVSVDHRSDPTGLGGPREKTVEQTDVSVKAPVGKSVDVRGGVRVDSRRDGDGTLEEVEPAPSVGIDVRF